MHRLLPVLAVLASVGLSIFSPRADLHAQEHESTSAQAGANPLPFDIPTIKRGRQLYSLHCVTCHGVDGRGDTEMREFLKTAPADLTDEIWVYGGHDAAVFDAIDTGRSERDMPGFVDKLNEERIWQVVTYIRYLGGERP